MNAGQVTTVGGTCELLGLVTVAWGLVDVASYRGDLARIRAWLDARRRTVVRRLLRRRGRVVQASGIASIGVSGHASMQVIRGPFNPRPDQSLEEQIAELGSLVNRLREDLVTQEREHRQAIDTLRKQTENKLQAERAHAEVALNAVSAELSQLRETTTGGLRLEIDGLLGVLVGVVFTTWPEAVAAWLPGWPPLRVAMSLLFGYVFLRISRAWLKSHEAKANASTGQQAGRDERAA